MPLAYVFYFIFVRDNETQRKGRVRFHAMLSHSSVRQGWEGASPPGNQVVCYLLAGTLGVRSVPIVDKIEGHFANYKIMHF